MSATACPSCNRPLAASVVNGPAQAVVRCEGCQTLLLWSNGRVMRSAKSATPTIMGMPAVTTKAASPVLRDAEAPLSELKPEADAPPQPPSASQPSAPKPSGKTPPPRSATQPMSRTAPPKQSVTGLGENVPTRVSPPTPELRKEAARKDPTPSPMKVPPSGPVKVAPAAPMKTAPSGPMKVPPSGPVKLPPAAPAAPKAPEAAEAPHVVVAAVAQVPKMAGGDMVDPSAWFAGGDVSEVVQAEKLPPIESSRSARADTTGAQPLPPPPSLPSLPPLEVEPFEIEAPGTETTPPIGTLLPEARSGPIETKIAAREPSQKVATPPAPKTPAPMKAVTDLPSQRTTIGKPPDASLRSTVMGRPALDIPIAKEPPRAEPAKTEPPKAEPLKTPGPKAEPIAAAVTMLPTPMPTPEAPGTAAPNAPRAVVEREKSAESLPPPPAAMAPPPSSLEATTETVLPPSPMPETTRVPREMPRRALFIAGGAAAGVLVLVLMVIGLSHGGKSPAKTVPPRPPVAATPPATTPQPSAPQAIAPKATAPQPSAPTKPPAPTPTPTPPPPTATPEPAVPDALVAPAPPRPRRTLGGKKVVLEYNPKPTAPTPPPPQAPTPMGEDPATVARAREAYHKGNVKLFAGDGRAAIDLYRESLKIYPGYVAGYRGLGLAYEEAGDKGEALKAFHTYVRTVPNAVDASIIRRRIDHLESRPAQ